MTAGGQVRNLLVLDSPRLEPYAKPTGAVRCEVFGDATAFEEAVRVARPDVVALLDPLTPLGRVRWEARRVLEAAGMVPVVAIAGLDPRDVAGVRELLAAGLSDWIDHRTEPGPAAAGPRLAAAVGHPLRRRIDPALPPYVSRNARALLHAAAGVVARGGGAPGLAAALGVRERTVAGWCAREGLPAPRRLHAWLRLLLAAALLETPRRTVLAAARAAGYANEQSLRRAMRAFLGDPAAHSPRSCPFDGVLRAFIAELGEIRDASRNPSAAAG